MRLRSIVTGLLVETSGYKMADGVLRAWKTDRTDRTVGNGFLGLSIPKPKRVPQLPPQRLVRESPLAFGKQSEAPGVDGPGRQVVAAENQIPYHEGAAAVVVVAFCQVVGVMPAVYLVHVEEVVEQAQLEIDVGVVQDGNVVVDEAHQQNAVSGKAQQHQGRQAQQGVQQRIDGVEAQAVQPVQFFRGVVDGVYPPPKGALGVG